MTNNFIYEPTNYNFPNLIVEETHLNGRHTGYRVTPADGYVFYDTTEENYEPDPNNDELEIPVTYYYTIAYLPLNYNFDNFQFVAVLRSSVDENYICGGGTTKPPEKV